MRVEGLVATGDAARQLVLGEREHGWSDADRAVDQAVGRFGSGAVRPATLVDPTTQNTGVGNRDTPDDQAESGRVGASGEPR